jgi:hypothetical protein
LINPVVTVAPIVMETVNPVVARQPCANNADSAIAIFTSTGMGWLIVATSTSFLSQFSVEERFSLEHSSLTAINS